MNASHDRIKLFHARLNFYKQQGWIKLLHRGVNKEFAFLPFNLSTKHNTIEQFAERLFFYGEKSKYHWKQKIGIEIDLNDVSNRTFTHIFKCFNEIATIKNANPGTRTYRKKNISAFSFFANKNNLPRFLNEIKTLDNEQKRQRRNYYFRIIHQLGETDHKKMSLHISSTTDFNVAENFSNGEIVVNFWDFNFKNFPLAKIKIPDFIDKPYKNEREISLFSVIFPNIYTLLGTLASGTTIRPFFRKTISIV